MPVNYGILRGKAIAALPYQHGTDHYQIEISAAGQNYRIAVDVYSQIAGSKKLYSADNHNVLDTDRMVMFYKDENFIHPITHTLVNCPEGFTAKGDLEQPLLLDYIRYKPSLFPLDAMKVIPPKDQNGKGEDLNHDIDPHVQEAINNPDFEIFACGSGWDDNAPGAHPDPHQYFHPEPSLGIHDIHMNQGDTGNEAKYNGTWQDGGLFIHNIPTDKWVAMFFRFQNQSTKTDNKTGNPI